MALKISLQLVAAVASSVAAATRTNTTTPVHQLDIATGFFDFCDQGSLQWYAGGQQAITADCSTDGEPVYFGSRLDLNYCFVNNDGNMALGIGGSAFDTCTCNMGEQIASCRPNCQSTQMECACENKKGGHSATAIDLNDYIGLGFDDDGHLVMECYSPVTQVVAKGTFLQCTKNGYTTECE